MADGNRSSPDEKKEVEEKKGTDGGQASLFQCRVIKCGQHTD